MALTVLIVGGGRIGRHLATMLQEGGHRIRVLESDLARARGLADALGTDLVVPGSGTDAAALEAAGIRNADVVAAVTGLDDTNLVVSSLARFEFAVPRVIARVVDPGNAWLFDRDMGVDAAVNEGDLLTHVVAEEMSLGEMTTLVKLRRGSFSLVEETVAPDAEAAGRLLGDLEIPPRCVIVAIIREGELRPGLGELRIEPGDEVLAVVHADEAGDLAEILGGDRHRTDVG